jgi:riboflavin synthase
VFTGLVTATGRVLDGQSTAHGCRLEIETELVGELRDGDSVAVNGVCLTAVGIDRRSFSADVMNETLARSALATLARGAAVNLELPLRASDRLGGHVVQGHVDGVGLVAAVQQDGFARRLRIEAPPEVMGYVVQKGSIAVDGVSLTIAELEDRSFTVSLIPETLQRTNLGTVTPGAKVNLEVDLIAKYVEKAVQSIGGDQRT